MTTIAYDQPVKDLIAGLDATGHVTHTAYRKTSVTFHHNGGRLSHEGVLEVWKTREASAHFDVDGAGAVAQYVRVNEYAWHAGNTEGNKSSIGIEMANATLAPDYTVAEATWKSAARLGGWLFARVMGTAPTRETVHYHHDWKSTLCAGPFMDKIREQFFQEVLAAYNGFAGTGSSAPAPSPSTPTPATPAPTTSFEQVVAGVIAGQYGTGDERARRVAATGQNYEAVRAEVNRRLGGGSAPAAPARKSDDQVATEVINGEWGNGPERSRRLQVAGYNPTTIQNLVNSRLGTSKPVAARLSVGQLADQVIRGQWGANPERRRRLVAAGYDADAVQAEVNRRL